MYAIFRREGAVLSHAWRVLESVAEDDGDVVVDGHRIADAELVRVETDREYLGAAGVGGLAGVAEGDDAPSASRQTDTEIPAPFDAIPTIDDPTDKERLGASVNYPPEAVPDEGPIPDVYHQHTREVRVTVPEWALAAARWRLEQRAEQRGRDELGRGDGVDFLFEYAQPMPEFVTVDGRDAVDVLLTDLEAADE